MLRCLLTHELVAGHTVMMRLAAKVDHFLALIAPDRPPAEQDRGCRQAVQLSGAAARLTERYRLGIMSLDRLERCHGAARKRPPGADGLADDFDDEDPFDGGPGGGRRKSPVKQLAELAALNKSMAAMLDRAKPNANGSQPQGETNRGRLRHGNPSGDFLASPRCGAKTRAGCACRQPAMANGRCRMHGGKSTGARTAEGLARCRTTRLVHGARSAEIIDLRSAAARHGRNLDRLTRLARASAAAQPRSEQSTPSPATPRRATAVVGVAPRGCPAVPPHDRPHGGTPSEPRFERSTPCPASRSSFPPRNQEGHEGEALMAILRAAMNTPSRFRGEFLSRRRKIDTCS
jgi:hypothetical protein